MQFRISELDNETSVIEIESGDEGPVVDLMNRGENGFAIFGEEVTIPIAVVDGRLKSKDWFTDDHLLAIEAHEVGHIRTGSSDEPTAEREGIRLLEEQGHMGASQLLRLRGLV